MIAYNSQMCIECKKHPCEQTAGWYDKDGKRVHCGECNPEGREHNVWCGACYPIDYELYEKENTDVVSA